VQGHCGREDCPTTEKEDQSCRECPVWVSNSSIQLGQEQLFKTLSPTPRDYCLTVPKSHMKTLLLPDQLLSEHAGETVETIDRSTVRERGPLS